MKTSNPRTPKSAAMPAKASRALSEGCGARTHNLRTAVRESKPTKRTRRLASWHWAIREGSSKVALTALRACETKSFAMH